MPLLFVVLVNSAGKKWDFQVPEPDVSDYVNDSFCVGNNTSDVTDLGDVTLLEPDCFTPDKIGTKTRAQVSSYLSVSIMSITKPKDYFAVSWPKRLGK